MATVAALDKSELDNTILFVESDNMYINDNGMTKTEFYPIGNKVNFFSKGFSVAWTPSAMKYVDEFGMDDTIYSVQDAPLEVKGNKARFDRSFPDVDDMFIVDGDRLKHTIIVQGWQRDPLPWLSGKIDFVISGRLEFDPSLTVHSMGMNLIGPFETGESIEIRNGEEVIFTLPKIVAYDSDIPQRAEAFGRYRVTANENGSLAFDIVMDNAWMADPERVYPILVDPTVIVASAYDTSGNGGRKVVMLSNSWLVALVKNDSGVAIYYKSTDKGTTWTELTRVNSGTNSMWYALTSKDTTIYTVRVDTSGSTMKFWKFDATSVGPIYDNANVYTYIDQSQTAFNSGVSLAINTAGTELHAAWSSKNPTYSSSFNVRYVKGTIDGTGNVTWGSVAQVTTNNTSGENSRNPCVVVRPDGLPLIIHDFYNGTTNYGIGRCLFNGTSWSISHNAVTAGWTGNYAQSNPSALFDSAGTLHCWWHGKDSVDSAKFNIRYAKSTDNGSTFGTTLKLTTGNSNDQQNPTAARDLDDNLYVFWEGIDPAVSATYFNIRKISYTGFWGTISTLTANTTGNAQSPNVEAIEAFDVIGWIYKDVPSSSVKFDLILFNVAPNPPTNLAPSGTSVDRSLNQRLSWQYNDPNTNDGQSKFDLQWRPVGSSTWNTVTQTTPNQYWDAPANTFPRGNIEWQVRTYDQANVVGPYSAQATFVAGDKPVAPTILEPSGVVTGPRPNVSWSSSDQTAYQVQALDGATPVWDSGEVVSGNKVVTVGVDLSNNKTYTFNVRIKNADGIWSDWASVSRSVSFTPPYTPTLSVVSDSTNARNSVVVTNPFSGGFNNLLGTDGNCEDTSKLTYTGGTAALDATRKTQGNNSVKVTKNAAGSYVESLASKYLKPNVGDFYIAIADGYLENSATNFYFTNTVNGVTRNSKLVTGTSGYSQTTIGQFMPIIAAYQITAVTTPGTSNLYPRITHTGTIGHIFNVDAFRVYKITQAEYDALGTSVDLATARAIAAQYPYVDNSIPGVAANEIYRRESGNTAWQRIAQGIVPNGTYNDYAVASGVTYEYKVKANGNNGTNVESAVASGLVDLKGVWLHAVTDPVGTIGNYPFDGNGRSSSWQTEVELMKFAGRDKPVAEFGEQEAENINVSIRVTRDELQYRKLMNLIRSREIVCYRDGRGRRVFGVCSGLPVSDENVGYTINLMIDEIDYSEEA